MSKQSIIGKLGTQWVKRVCVSIIALVVLSGCEGVHLYDQGKNETATAINTKMTKIDIEKVFKTERKNLQALLDHEIIIRNRFIEEVRSQEIWKFVYKRQTFNSVLRPGVNRYAARRLEQLGVVGGGVTLDDAANAEASLNRYIEVRGGIPRQGTATQLAINSILSELKEPDGINWKDPYPCAKAIPKSVDEAVSDSEVKSNFEMSLRELFSAYKALCNNTSIDVAYVEKVMSTASDKSLFKEAFSEFESALTELKNLERAVKAAKRNLPKKKKKDETQKDFIAKLQKGANDTAKSLGFVAEASKVLGFDKAQTEERVAALSIILRAFGGGALPDLSDAEKGELKKRPSLHRAAIIAAGLPGLTGDIKKLNALLSDPGGRAGLAIQFGYQQLKLKYLERRVELVKQRAQLAADQLWAHLYEAVFFRNADRAMDAAEKALMEAKKSTLEAAEKKKQGALNDTEKTAALKAAKLDFSTMGGLNYFQVQALPKSKAKRLVNVGLLEFDMSMSVARRRADTLSYRLIDARHQEINAADAFAARAWKNLLDGPIKQIQAYHATGIKSEEISEIVSSLTGLGILGFIGAKEAN